MRPRNLPMMTLVLFCVIALPSFTQESRLDSNRKSAQENQSAIHAAGTNDLRTDLAKMQILLEQMQRNVAFVSPGDTPLKHQFQLEIEMWQLLIRDMQKKAGSETE